MEHTKTKDTLLFQNLDCNLSIEEERRGQIATKVKQNKKKKLMTCFFP